MKKRHVDVCGKYQRLADISLTVHLLAKCKLEIVCGEIFETAQEPTIPNSPK